MGEYAVTYNNLRVSHYQFEHILELKITSEINEHATLKLRGILQEAQKENNVYLDQGATPIEVYYIEQDDKKSIFNGVVTHVTVQVTNNVYHIDIEAKSYTYLMDILKKSKSFQDITLLAPKLVQQVMEDYKGADVIVRIPEQAVGKLVVQYEETDWEFIRRFVSRYGEGIFPEIQRSQLKYTVGVPKGSETYSVETNEFIIHKSINNYQSFKKNDWQDATESDFLIYELQNERVFKLGDQLVIEGKVMYVSKLTYELVEGILVNTYYLQIKSGLRQKKRYNKRLIGASINGFVLEVQRDNIKAQLIIDEKQDKSKAYWFPYSTMSASPDGSGWYCMPEIDDNVRIYLPTKNESEAFAVSAISGYIPQQVNESDRMGNPDVKYLRTIHDKEVKFTPEGILINADSGQAYIQLNKDGTVSIVGEKTIDVTARERVTITSAGDLVLAAQETIDIKCDAGGEITMDKDGQVKIRGTEIKSN